MTKITWQPLDDRVLILPDPQETMIGSLHIEDDKKPKKLTGTIVAVGTGVPLMNVKLNITTEATPAIKELIELIKEGRPMKTKPGDRVAYGQFAGTRVPIDGVEYLMMRESDVFMREICQA